MEASISIQSLSTADFQNRNSILLKERELVINTGKVLGIDFKGNEKEALSRLEEMEERDEAQFKGRSMGK